MSDYTTAHEAMSGFIEATSSPMENFGRTTYRPAFDQLYTSYVPAFDALERLYKSVGEPETMLQQMADALIEEAVRQTGEQTRKGRRERRMMELNMSMACYIFPCILHYQGEFSQPLVDILQVRWKEAFPKSSIKAAEVEYIENGFRRKFCYVTTAVCRSLHKPDDCTELQTLRHYRDTYLASLPEGEQMIHDYYDVAPTIVKHINGQPDADRIYRSIWDQYISKCLGMITDGENEGCCRLYEEMVGDLMERYFQR